jgi:uncharacterized protein (DUF427 family)
MRIEPGAKRVRAYLNGAPVADTIHPMLVWEKPQYPTYYFPRADVIPELRGDEPAAEELHGLVRLEWDAVDAWFEEDEQVFTHARDPYTRVDVLASSRTVRVELDGEPVAESAAPRMLFETGLPVRYYLPRTHVRMELLTPTDTVSHCPYKGQAEWWSVRAGGRDRKDLAWSYRAPFPESQKIAGLIAFYNERSDIYVDGELQARPVTKFTPRN